MERLPRGFRIAVLDDDESVLKALRRLLQASGYDVGTFSSGSDLLDSMDSAPPDCLLLDVHVAGMSGLDLLRHVRMTDSRLPAIVITAFDGEETRRRALDDGASAYFRKPFDNETLMQSIAACIGRSPDTTA